MKIAVVGAGISGLGAAWLLSKRHEVVVFEKNAHLGGHSDTTEVLEPGGSRVPVDTGFIVYNTACYPNLVALFDHLAVPTAATDMSFAVSLNDGGYEYSGNGLSGLFAQRRNFVKPSHWSMTRDILRFFREVSALDPRSIDPHVTIGSWFRQHGYGEAFLERHIVPMGAAIWSMPGHLMLGFPMAAFARFFDNHGLLVPDLAKRPPWRTVRGGSREYVRRVRADCTGRFALGAPAVSIKRSAAGVQVTLEDGATEDFDQCVVATHADQALSLLSDADDIERGLLGAFGYSENEAVLHTDKRLMPRRKRAWASWNYIGPRDSDQLSVSYWMNQLQPLETERDYFVTLNPCREIAPDTVLKVANYQHPIFDVGAMAAQRDLWALQGRRRTWFAGSYFGYGFHEDGLQAGLAVAEDLGGVKRPWSVADDRGRILSNECGDGCSILDAAQ